MTPLGRIPASARRLALSIASAAALVIAVDCGLLGNAGPWETIDRATEECEEPCHEIRSRTFTEFELAHLARAEPGKWRVVVIGSSRAGAGYDPLTLAEGDASFSTLHIAKAAIASLQPYAMRTLSSRLGRGDADEVVLFLSEFDTHRPVYLVPSVGFGGTDAWLDFARLTGFEFGWKHREPMLRLAAAALSNTYRHRDVIQTLGRNYAPRLATPAIVRDSAATPAGYQNALAGEFPVDAILPAAEFARVSGEIRSQLAKPVAQGPFTQIRSISWGDHVDVQKSLVTRSIRRFLANDIRVMIVEPPLHPLAERLYDTRTRTDFRRFAHELANDSRVQFLGLEGMAAFRAQEFSDLTHLNVTGAKRYTRRIIDQLADGATRPNRPPTPAAEP